VKGGIQRIQSELTDSHFAVLSAEHVRGMKMTRLKNMRSTERGAGAAPATEQRDESRELLLWTRLAGKGLYELYRLGSKEFCVQLTRGTEMETRPIEPAKATSIISRAINKRRQQLNNELLSSGYAELIDGTTYDTRIDEVYHFGAKGETEAAAIYRTRDGHAYVHMAEPQQDLIHRLRDDDEVEQMADLIDFWFNHKPPFRRFVDIMLWGGVIA